MQITEFTNQMVTLIKSKVSTEMKNVQSHTIWKNNGIQEEGITLIEKGVNISPTVYMREYYDRFLQGETLRALAEEVIEELERCKTYKSMDISFFLSFENAKKHIVYKLVNREKNEELLKLFVLHGSFHGLLLFAGGYAISSCNDTDPQFSSDNVADHERRAVQTGIGKYTKTSACNDPQNAGCCAGNDEGQTDGRGFI